MLQTIEIETPLFDEEVDLAKTWKRQSDLLRPLIPLTKDTQTITLEYLQPKVDRISKPHRHDEIKITFCNDTCITFYTYKDDMTDVMGDRYDFMLQWHCSNILIKINDKLSTYDMHFSHRRYKMSFPDGYPLFESPDFKILVKGDKSYVWKGGMWIAL